MKYEHELAAADYTDSKIFHLVQDMEYTFTLNGTGNWRTWDGVTWKNYEESTGTSQVFVGLPPPDGQVQLLVTSGTVTAGFRLFNPTGRRL